MFPNYKLSFQYFLLMITFLMSLLGATAASLSGNTEEGLGKNFKKYFIFFFKILN